MPTTFLIEANHTIKLVIPESRQIQVTIDGEFDMLFEKTPDEAEAREWAIQYAHLLYLMDKVRENKAPCACWPLRAPLWVAISDDPLELAEKEWNAKTEKWEVCR